MARFRFKLDPVLRQRAQAEQAEQMRVASIERERIAIEDELRSLQSTIEAESAELAALGQGGRIDPAVFRSQGVALMAVRAEAQQRALALASVLKRLSAARRVLGERAAERRAMELLRDRRLEAFRAEERRAEDRVADDLFMAARARHEAAGGEETES